MLFKILAISFLLTLLFLILFPRISVIFGTRGLTAADVASVKLVQNRERQHAWITTDPQQIEELLAYFDRIRGAPFGKSGVGAYLFIHIQLAAPGADGSDIIYITCYDLDTYIRDDMRSYFVLGPVKTEAEWQAYLARCEKIH